MIRLKAIVFFSLSAVVGCAIAACGGAQAKPAPTSAPGVSPTPAGSSTASAAGACAKLGGKCTSMVATVACKSQPSADCADSEICCVN